MLKNNKILIGLLIVLGASLSLSPTVMQASSCIPPSWATEIIDNTTIIGLTKDGEKQLVNFMGKGSWNSVVEVWFFAVWRLHRPNGDGWEADLQAHIELAKIGDGVYKMEIYHSWTTPTVEMPYNFTIIKENSNLLILRIMADL